MKKNMDSLQNENKIKGHHQAIPPTPPTPPQPSLEPGASSRPIPAPPVSVMRLQQPRRLKL